MNKVPKVTSKVTIRKQIFETNSSSTHAIILTNEKNYKKDFDEQCNQPFTEIVNYNAIKTKEDKVICLAGLFDYETLKNKWLTEEYKLFIQILKDNNEKELLDIIKDNKKKFKKTPYDEPSCCDYFSYGPLADCTCCFYKRFKDYFKIEINYYSIYTELSKTNNCNESDFTEKVNIELAKQKEKLYNKLYEFIYNDGIIVTYDEW